MKYKEGTIVETDKGVFQLKNGEWVAYTQTMPPGKVIDKGSIGRQLGLTGRYLVEGATGIPSLLADAPANIAGLFGVDVPKSSESIQNLLNIAGFPEPKPGLEQTIATPSRALAGVGATGALGNMLSGAVNQVVSNVGQTLAANPTAQALSAVGGGLSAEGAREMGGGPYAQMLASLAGGIAAPAVGNRLMNMLRPEKRAKEVAESMVAKAFERDDLPEDAAKKLVELGPEGKLIDAGGPNIRMLAQSSVSAPGKARKTAEGLFNPRSEGSVRRIIGDLRRILGTNKNAFETTKKIIESRKTESAPYYESANKQLVQVDDDLLSIFDRSYMKSAWQKGLNKAQNDPDWPVDITIPKDLSKGKTVPLAALDYTKRALDDRILTAIKAGKKDDARIYQSLKTSLLSKLDHKYPDYAKAREIFTDRSAMLSALEIGKKILRTEPDEMLDFLSDMSKSEKEMVVVGAIKSITDKLKGTKIGSNSANRLSTELVRERIKPAFPDDESFNNFIRGLERENIFMQSKSILGGSPTQPREAAAAQFASEALEAISGSTQNILQRAVNRFVMGNKQIPERVRDEIAEILFVESMAKPGSFSNRTIARLEGYRIPRAKINELSNSLMNLTAQGQGEQ